MLKAGILNISIGDYSKLEGIPQGNILSPLLCNIYMHKLDVFIEDLSSSYNKGQYRKINPE